MNATAMLWKAATMPGSSSHHLLEFEPLQYPVYYAPRARLLPWISDKDLTLLIPIAVYWIASLVFTFVDMSGWHFFEQYRIHEPEAIKKRNRVTMKTVIIAVVVQQIIQTLLGMAVLDEQDAVREAFADHKAAMERYGHWISRVAFAALGKQWGEKVLRSAGVQLTSWMYWWGVPIMQFLFAR